MSGGYSLAWMRHLSIVKQNKVRTFLFGSRNRLSLCLQLNIACCCVQCRPMSLARFYSIKYATVFCYGRKFLSKFYNSIVLIPSFFYLKINLDYNVFILKHFFRATCPLGFLYYFCYFFPSSGLSSLQVKLGFKPLSNDHGSDCESLTFTTRPEGFPLN